MQNNNQWGMNQNNNFGQYSYVPGRSTIPGKIINTLKDIYPQDVPTDGSPAAFIQNDASCVYLKFWGGDCDLKTVKYVVDPTFVENSTPQDPMNEIINRLNSIEEQLRQRPKQGYNHKNKGGYQNDKSTTDSNS